MKNKCVNVFLRTLLFLRSYDYEKYVIPTDANVLIPKKKNTNHVHAP
jgi:hypothetical protein